MNTTFKNSFSEEVWASTYKDHNDTTIDDTLRRVARAVAGMETTDENKKVWEENFYDMLSQFKVVPGGRILSNAGTEFNGTTLLNCFVIPEVKGDADSLEGILKKLRYQAVTLKSEGGVGFNASVWRPRGSFINGIGVETPGAIKFAELFDKSSEIITAGSGLERSNKKAKGKIRKGAQMLVLDCWHPDVPEFITAKQVPNRLTKFNMSVNCTNEFMDTIFKVEQMKTNGASEEEIAAVDKWDLVFPETTFKHYKKEWDGNIAKWKSKGYPVVVHKTVEASWLWNLIMTSTYSRAEPGVLFLDRANELNNMWYNDRDYIDACNPCLTAETLVATADGRGTVSIGQLAEEGKDVPVYCYDENEKVVIRTMRNPRLTGKGKEIYEIKLDDGSVIRATSNHKFLLTNKNYVEVKDLVPGSSLRIMSKFTVDSHGQKYMIVGGKREHNLIASFSQGNPAVPKGYVVHHKDFNGLNNSPDNLQIMSIEDHDAYHGSLIVGDNNPMRRAQTEWSDEKWDEYKTNMSASVSGDKNGRYSGLSNEDLLRHAVILTQKLDRRFTFKDWEKYARENGLMTTINKWRKESFGSVGGLAQQAATIVGINIDLIGIDARVAKTYKAMNEQGYECELINGLVYVNKKCECCDKEFKVPSDQRERSFCSLSCSSIYSNRMRTPEQRAKNVAAARVTFDKQKKENRIKQIQVFNDLQFGLKRTPLRSEWENKCKELGISFRVGPISPFKTFAELKSVALDFNHKVVSVTLVGHEDVYNGTVDEFHNFFVGGFTTNQGDCSKIQFVNNKNCGEQMLAKGSVCLLSSINLTQFVDDDRTFDFKKFEKYVGVAIRFMDNVNDLTATPLEEYKEYVMTRRRIGLGLMGWGSALYMMGVRFASKQAFDLKEKMMHLFTRTGIKTSIELAKEKGMFSACEPEKYVQSKFFQQIGLESDIIADIKKYGIRNSTLFSCQPTGNSGVMANNISGGIEPIFTPEYIRTVIVNFVPEEIKEVTPRYWEGHFHETEMFKSAKEGEEEILRGVAPDGTVYKIDKNRGLTKEVLCEDYGVLWLKERNLWTPEAEYVVSTNDLSADDHIADLKGFAKYIDSAISKTINLPNDYSYENFKNIYLDGYNTGYIKGLTTYRAGTMTSVLSAKEENTADEFDEEIILDHVHLPSKANATMATLKAEGRKWYLTSVYNDNQNRPFAVFVHTNHPEKSTTTNDAVERLVNLAYNKKIRDEHITNVIGKIYNESNTAKLTRMVSFLLRHGVLIKNIVSELENVENVGLGSFLYQLSKYLSQYIKDGEKVEGEECPNCGTKNSMIYSEGCKRCISCDSSRC